MDLWRRFKKAKDSRVGIDIGSYAVKAVEISGSEKENPEIKSMGYAKVEKPGSRESLTRAIKKSISAINVIGKEVRIAVSGPSVIIRFIELPRMSEDELRNAISYEAEKYIPFGINEVIIDHQLLIPRLGDNKMLVLLVAAKKDVVNECLNLASESGLSVGILDAVSLANVNAFLADPTRKKNEISALIDMGAKATDISIIDEDALYFTRCLQSGGNDITKALSEALSLSPENAEKVKTNPADKKKEVSERVESILRTLTDEIRLSFGYYENQSGKSIVKVYLTGGGTRIVNLRTMLKEELGIDIVAWDPTSFLKIHPSVDTKLLSSVKDQLGAAVGLALRG